MESEDKDTEAWILELEAELENPELNGELDDFLSEVGADDEDEATDAELVFVVAHNGMSEDMKEIDALYIIESAVHKRSAIVRVTWETQHPKEPKDILVEFCTDADQIKKRRIDASRQFRNELADGDYCRRDMDMGLIRLRGHQHLWQCGGVAEVITGTMGRNGAGILSFLEGNENYQADDLTYENSWGSW